MDSIFLPKFNGFFTKFSQKMPRDICEENPLPFLRSNPGFQGPNLETPASILDVEVPIVRRYSGQLPAVALRLPRPAIMREEAESPTTFRVMSKPSHENSQSVRSDPRASTSRMETGLPVNPVRRSATHPCVCCKNRCMVCCDSQSSVS